MYCTLYQARYRAQSIISVMWDIYTHGTSIHAHACCSALGPLQKSYTVHLEQCTVYGNSTRKITPIYMHASCPTKLLRTSFTQPSIISHMGQLARMVCNRVIPIPEGIDSLCQYIELKLYKRLVLCAMSCEIDANAPTAITRK